MEDKVIFEKDSASIKNPEHLKRNVLITFSPRTVKVEPATCRKIDSEVVAFLPQKSKGFFTSIFRGDEINELFSGKYRLEILNKSFEDSIEIKRNEPLGFLVVEPENLKFQYVPSKKKAPKKGKQTYTPKTKKANWRFSWQV